MKNRKLLGSLIDLKAPACMLTVNFVRESFQDRCCVLTANSAFIELYNSVGIIVSNEVIAKLLQCLKLSLGNCFVFRDDVCMLNMVCADQ